MNSLPAFERCAVWGAGTGWSKIARVLARGVGEVGVVEEFAGFVAELVPSGGAGGWLEAGVEHFRDEVAPPAEEVGHQSVAAVEVVLVEALGGGARRFGLRR